MLTAIRGNAKRFDDKSLKSWLLCDRGRHSAKPDQVRTFIERASPGPYLELFSRRDDIQGWKVWGNQIERSLFRRPVQETVTEMERRILRETGDAQNVIQFGS